MREQQRHRLRAAALDVQVVQVDAMQRHRELREGVEPRFLGAPVEATVPVLDQLLEVADIRAGGPRRAGRLVGKAGAGQTLAHVGDGAVGDVEMEGTWCGHGSDEQLDGLPESRRLRTPDQLSVEGDDGCAGAAARDMPPD